MSERKSLKLCNARHPDSEGEQKFKPYHIGFWKTKKRTCYSPSHYDTDASNKGEDSEIELSALCSCEERLSSIVVSSQASLADADIEKRFLLYPHKATTSAKMPVLRTVTKIKSAVHLAMVILAWLSSSKLLTDSDHLESYPPIVRARSSILKRRLVNSTDDSVNASDDSVESRTKQLHVVKPNLREHINILAEEKRIIQRLERKKQQLDDVSSDSSSREHDYRDGKRIDQRDHSTNKRDSSSIAWNKANFLVAWMRRGAADKRQAKTPLATDGVDMNFLSWTALVTVLLCCSACQLYCLLACSFRQFVFASGGTCVFFDDFKGVGFLELCGFLGYQQGYTAISKESYVPLLRREARLMLLLPLIPLACLPITTCEDGTPDKAYLIYLLFLFRARAIECQLLYKLGARWDMFLYMMVFSTFEQTDWFTDGSFPAQAYACDALMTPGLVHALKLSRFPFLAGVVSILRFYGLAILLFLSAAFSQQALASWNSAEIASALAADTAGFVAFAEIAAQETKIDEDTGFSPPKMLTCGVKVFLENCLQLRLQGSGFALTFLTTSRWAKAKALLSLGLGAGSAVSKVMSNALPMLGALKKEAHWDLVIIFLSISAVLICLVGPLCVVALTAAQIYFGFACPSLPLSSLEFDQWMRGYCMI